MIPGTSVPIMLVLHALRLSLGYQRATRKSTSWLQGMLSVCALPMAGGMVATFMTGSLPPFLLNDVVIPTYMVTYLVVHNSGMLRGLLGAIPPQILDFLTLPADCIIKSLSICSTGVDGITSHYSAAVKHNWFAPIFVGGSVGSAGFLTLTSLNLFSPIWTLSTRLDAVEFELYGPYVLSFMYLALQGSNPQINNLVWSISQGVLGGRHAKYFTKEEARVLVTLTMAGVQVMKSVGIWNGRMPGGSERTIAARPVQSRKLGGGPTGKKEL